MEAIAEAQLIGREPELSRLEEFLAGEGTSRSLVVTGEPGIGKTKVWEAGIAAARERGSRVFVARPRESELQLSYASLADLFEEVEDETLGLLRPPQMHALQVALLRVEPAGRPPEERAVATGFLNVLRYCARHGRVVVAVDDVQWLDRQSAGAIAFARHRLRNEDVAFLLASRIDDPAESERLELGPLSLGATRRILFDRLGASVPRRALRRICELSGGNPLFALELGRRLADQGSLAIGEEVAVPAGIDELLEARVAQLPVKVRRLLLAVALGGDMTVPQLAALAEAEAVDQAVEEGVLVVERDRVRPAHPLLAAAVRARSSERERQALHHALADIAVQPELEARHRALGTPDPDETVARAVAAAAEQASARGAIDDAVELAEHALRLTPAGSDQRPTRLLALAGYLLVVGDHELVTELLADQADELPTPSARAEAYLLLGASRFNASHVDETGASLDRALAESVGDPELHARATAGWARYQCVGRVERIAEAERAALEVLPAAREAGPDVEREVLHALAFARKLLGRPFGDLRKRFEAASPAAFDIRRSLERMEADQLGLRGHVSEARTVFRRLLALADERGERWSYMWVLLGLCELELRAGEWEAASRLLDEWDHSLDASQFAPGARERCWAFLVVGRGDADEGRRRAARIMQEDETLGARWNLLEASRARGMAELLARRPAQAAEILGAVWEHSEREGVEEPAEFPVAPDLVEALVELDRLDEARAVTERLTWLAEQQEHPWGLATAKRCSALIQLAAGADGDGPRAALEEAAAAYGELGLRFDRARTLLALGRAQRRRKSWAAARRVLERAVAAFEEIGSPGWADQARSELSRVGARRPGGKDRLTPAEERTAALAAEGLSNKEIASALVVSVHTVEVHLSHAYAKLGVRSRAQLAKRLAAS
jgi:DNA-binding CsgD family transcriptional regulator